MNDDTPRLLDSLIGVPVVVVGGRSAPVGTKGVIKEITMSAFMGSAKIRVTIATSNGNLCQTNINHIALTKDVTISKYARMANR